MNCPPPCCGQPLDSVLLRVHFFPSLSPLRHFERPEVKSWETQPRMVTLQLSFEQYSPSLRQLIQTSKVSESVLQTKPFLKSNIEVLETWRLFVTVDYNIVIQGDINVVCTISGIEKLLYFSTYSKWSKLKFKLLQKATNNIYKPLQLTIDDADQ